MTEKRTYKSHQERLMMEALDIICGARRSAYGPPERNFHRIALLWTAYRKAKAAPVGTYDAMDVCLMQDLVKLARLIETPDHEDSMRDRFGYGGCYVDLVLNKNELAGWQDWPPVSGQYGDEPVSDRFDFDPGSTCERSGQQ